MTESKFVHPGFMGRVKGFVVSFTDWFAMGMPWRAPEETQELFSSHCLPCPEYDPEKRAFIGWPKGTCLACLCHVSGDADEMLNKVNKPHQGCPLDKWKKVIDHDA